MTLKRPVELVVGNSDGIYVDNECNDGEPPAKRRLASVPRTPFLKRSSLPVAVQPFIDTPYPSRPLDSPTNPVGRKRTQNLAHSLPSPTSFSKHLPLRFQFVRPGVSPRMGGIYRVVQVPLSYTFVHLRCLIAFLYGGGFGDEREDRHLFEVKKKLTMYAVTYRPGQIRQGFTAVKLSTARDPCRYKPESVADSLDEFIDGPEPSEVVSDSEESGDEEPTWKWELEEEFTLGHVWSRGPELGAGIIYHHNETTAVHITINTTSLPRRQGHSNTPYVFTARGRVRIHLNSFLPLPKPIFSVPIRKLSIPLFRDSDCSASNYGEEEDAENEDDGEEDNHAEEENVAEDEDLDDDDSNPEVGDARSCGFLNGKTEGTVGDDTTGTDEEEDEEEEDENDNPDIFLGVKKLNSPHAFAAYLRFVHQHGQRHQYPVSDESDDEDEDFLLHRRSTPTLVHSSSSPISSSPIRTSSIVSPSSLSFVSPRRRKSLPYDPYAASVSTLTSLSSTTSTPVPAHTAWQLRRIERIQKRMDKYKKKAWMCYKDEEAEEMVDQLAQEQNPADPQKDNQCKLDKPDAKEPIPPPPLWKKPELGEVINLFADEIEV